MVETKSGQFGTTIQQQHHQPSASPAQNSLHWHQQRYKNPKRTTASRQRRQHPQCSSRYQPQLSCLLILIVATIVTTMTHPSPVVFFVQAFSFLPTAPGRPQLSQAAIASKARSAAVSRKMARRLFSSPPTASAEQGAASTAQSSSRSRSTLSAVELRHADFSASASSSATKATAERHHHRPPAIFLHGLLGNKRNFASIARSLAQQLDRPRRILGLDLRNHGTCARPRLLLPLLLLADWLAGCQAACLKTYCDHDDPASIVSLDLDPTLMSTWLLLP